MSRPSTGALPRATLDQIFGALADPTRRAILDLLRERGEVAAGAIGKAFPSISRPAVSKHLRVLRAAGLVEERRDGRFVRYRLAIDHLTTGPDAWLEPFRRAWAEKLVDLKRYVERRGDGSLP